MKKFLTYLTAFMIIAVSTLLVSCGDEPSGSKSNGGYGDLKGNLIAIGLTRDVTYTSAVLLGTVAFDKITSDHTYGIVYMEECENPDFDYNLNLIDGGHSDKNAKYKYVCISERVTSSASDGKFEKQLVNLKPATTYYYRAYVRVGQNVNYSEVEKFVTTDPMPEITMSTGEATDIYAVSGTMNGFVNVGNLMDVNEAQFYGFIFTTYEQLNDPAKLSYEYYNEWKANHYETDEDIEAPEEVTTDKNLNGRISRDLKNLIPGTTYYYRTFFRWNGKYFYSPEIKTLKTKGLDEITVGTNPATAVTGKTATLNGTFPYSLVGLEKVTCGFMISQVYSNPSEFNMENESVSEWADRKGSNSEVFYIQGSTTNKDFSVTIRDLESETIYYVCAYIYLGTFNGKPMYVYGPIQWFKTESSEASTDDISIWSEGAYSWTMNNDGSWTSGNSGVDNSHSYLYVEVNHKAGETLYFDLTVSSESNYDGVKISYNNFTSNLISGNYEDEYSIYFSRTGTTVITIDYQKDSSSSSGRDRAIVEDFRLQ
ncbi:MAG: hypothetical protein HDS24_04205 [Bacteroides sp.]|nr:hypothetical protein [Bacteroides sp.]